MIRKYHLIGTVNAAFYCLLACICYFNFRIASSFFLTSVIMMTEGTPNACRSA